MKQNKALHCDKLFIRELRKNLGKKTNLKKAYIPDIKEDVHRYMNEHPDADLNSLYEFFGEPEKLATEFLSRNDFSDLKKKAMKYTVWRSVAIGVIILFIISAIAVYPHLKMIGGTIVVTDDFSSQETPLE